jgi:glycosyltransferase, group 2 family
MPKVSIIIPVYGVEKYIERCARSLFEQTLDDIEYLFIDDSTPDRSIDILKRVLENYPHRKSQVNIHRMEQNSGQAIVRNWGMQNATGEYVIHCDSDDWVDTDMYRAMYEEAKDKNADVVVCDYDMTDGVSNSKRVNACHASTPKQLIESCLFQRDPWSLCNKLFKGTAYYNIVHPQGAMGEDMATTMQLLWNCKKLSYMPQSYYKYFYNNKSITKVISKDSCARKYDQLAANTKIIMNFVDGKDINPDALIVYKNSIRAILYPLVYEDQYYKLWNNMFEGLNWQVLKSSNIPMIEKVRVILTILHLYPRKQFRAV